MTFCPACENDLLEDAHAFGYDGPIHPGRDMADDEPVLCEKHAAEYPSVCLCGAPVARPGDFTCGNPECVAASIEDDPEPAEVEGWSGVPRCLICEETIYPHQSSVEADGRVRHADCGPCSYCGKDDHNGGCRAQERHDARCL